MKEVADGIIMKTTCRLTPSVTDALCRLGVFSISARQRFSGVIASTPTAPYKAPWGSVAMSVNLLEIATGALEFQPGFIRITTFWF